MEERRDRPLAAADPLGGRGVRRERTLRRALRHGGLALLALIAAGAVPQGQPSDLVKDVLARIRELGDGSDESYFALVELWGELVERYAEEGSDTEVSWALSEVGGRLGALGPREGGPTRLELLESVVPTGLVERLVWRDRLEVPYAEELCIAGRSAEAEHFLEALVERREGRARIVALIQLLQAQLDLRHYGAALRTDGSIQAELPVLEGPAELEPGARERALAVAAAYHGARGVLNQHLGRLDLAQREHRLEQELAEASGSPQARLNSWKNRADLFLLTENDDRVEWIVKNELSEELLLTATPDVQAALGLYRTVAKLEARLAAGEVDRSLEEDLLVLSRNERLQASGRVQALRLAADCARRRGEPRLARERLQGWRALLADAGRDGSSLEVAHGRVLEAEMALESGAEPEAFEALRADLRTSWDALLERLETVPPAPGGVGPLHLSGRRQILSSLIELELRVEGPATGAEHALARVLEAESRGSTARRFELPAVDLATLREGLRTSGEAVLHFLPSKDRSHVLALDGEGVRCFEAARWDELRPDLNELVSLLRRAPPRDAAERDRRVAELDRCSHAVSRGLLCEALLTWLQGHERVSCVGLSLLRDLPPEALRFPDGRFLGQELELSTLPSLTVGQWLLGRSREPRAPRAASVLIATLDPGAKALEEWNLSTLPLAGKLQPLTEPLGEHLRTFVDGAADDGALDDLARAPLVHFFVHGVTRDDLERPAALLLSGNARESIVLTCDDVEELELSGIVILSACATTRGPGRPGDDNLAHLGGAFLCAGARAVVLAGAPMESAWVIRFQGLVHQRLAAGNRLGQALREARRGVCGDDPMAPWLGAQFGVLGLGGARLSD